MNNWHQYFLGLAKYVSSASKDPTTKVGACIVDDKKRIVSVGYNGFPRGVEDNLNVDRDIKLARTIHAEANAILFAQRDLTGCVIYVTRPPCSHCAALIIQSGITQVVYEKPSEEFLDRWGNSVLESIQMFQEAGVHIIVEETNEL